MKKPHQQAVVKETSAKPSVQAEILSWVKTLAIALIIGLFVSHFIKPTLVSGESMSPTLHDSNYLLLNRTAYKHNIPNYKDIIVFESTLPQEKVLIKRVIGTEGQKVTVKDGKVYINDQLINEDSYLHGITTPGSFDGVVPKGMVFVMGDNRGNSLDSRYAEVGYVDVNRILGKVFVRLLPMKGIED